jgi:hypothetical protein
VVNIEQQENGSVTASESDDERALTDEEIKGVKSAQ